MNAPFIIAAIAGNRAIGRAGAIPWHLSGDLKRFKALTMGHAVIMGRRTWLSIGRPLPGRLNIVVSSTLEGAPEGVAVRGTLEEALELAASKSELEPAVIGGARLYEEALPLCSRLELTRVGLNPEGCDAFFPEWRGESLHFRLACTQEGADGAIPFSYETWVRAD